MDTKVKQRVIEDSELYQSNPQLNPEKIESARLMLEQLRNARKISKQSYSIEPPLGGVIPSFFISESKKRSGLR